MTYYTVDSEVEVPPVACKTCGGTKEIATPIGPVGCPKCYEVRMPLKVDGCFEFREG